MDLENAFAERGWKSYLSPPTSTSPHDLNIMISATAFLTQSIPYEHELAIPQCKTVYSIWQTFQQRYDSKACEDEVRLEAQILDMRKLATDDLDAHINKFDALAVVLLDQQPDNHRYEDFKVNQYFLRTLE